MDMALSRPSPPVRHRSLTIAAAVPLAIIHAAEQLGYAADELKAVAGLNSHDQSDRDSWVPYDTLYRLWQHLSQAAPDSGLGLRIAQQSELRRFGLFAFIVQNCPTLGDAQQTLQRYQHMLHPTVKVRVEIQGDDAHVVFAHLEELRQLTDPVDFTVARWYRNVVELAGRPVHLETVWFAHAAPVDTSAYTALFGCPVHFGQPETKVTLPAATFALPIATADAELHAYLTSYAATVLHTRTVTPPGDDLNEVRQAIMASLLAGKPGIRDVAKRLSLSVRTLQRRVVAAGFTYSEVSQACRLGLAQHLLQQADHSQVDVAFALGYADANSFQRAFRQWTGLTPAQYRKQTQGGE